MAEPLAREVVIVIAAEYGLARLAYPPLVTVATNGKTTCCSPRHAAWLRYLYR